MSQSQKEDHIKLLAEILEKEALTGDEKRGQTAEPSKETSAAESEALEDPELYGLPAKRLKESENEAVFSVIDELPRFLPPVVALPSIASLVSGQEAKAYDSSILTSCPLPPLSETGAQQSAPQTLTASIRPSEQSAQAQPGKSTQVQQQQEQHQQKPQTYSSPQPSSCPNGNANSNGNGGAQAQGNKEHDSLMKLGCRGSMLVSDLKRHIEAKTGILFDHQMLIFKGQRLCDTSTLHDVGLDKESIVHLVVQVRKPSAVPHTPSDHSHSLNGIQ